MYLSLKHPNINFSFEKENDGCLSFLDIFQTNVYQKKTFSGVYTYFNSFIPEIHKTVLIKSLLFQCFSLCLHFVKFHHEMNVLKIVLYKISYPQDFVDKRVTEFLDRILMLKIVVSTVHKKDFMTVQPYLSKRSLQFLTKINCVMKNKPPYCNF